MALVTGCRVKPSKTAGFRSAGMLAVLVLVARRPLCVPGELDSVGVGAMRAPAARQQPAALGRPQAGHGRGP